MMEKLKSPQTHVSLKAMIAEVDEDQDGTISFSEFLLIFRKAAAGLLVCEGLKVFAKTVDVAAEGVSGAKSFFDGKAAELARASKSESEIRAEQEAKKQEKEAQRLRREAMQQKAAIFGGTTKSPRRAQ